MRSVCNQLCKEFMTDILHITNRSDSEDVTQLQNYLLHGRGWILLQVMQKKGVQVTIIDTPKNYCYIVYMPIKDVPYWEVEFVYYLTFF
mgnify:FL=1